jgi:putative sigma-54 modulation protein
MGCAFVVRPGQERRGLADTLTLFPRQSTRSPPTKELGLEVKVHARGTALTDQFRQQVVDKVAHAGRFLDGGAVDVEFSEEQNPRLHDARFRMELTTISHGRTLRIESTASTLEAALDLGVERFGRQLSRLKDRLVDRGRRSEARPNAVAPPAGEPEESQIVRVKQFVMKPMTAEEAALQMDMLGHDFFFFMNANSSRQCVLYRRKDGRLGLIEPA